MNNCWQQLMWIQDLFPVPFISRRFKMRKPRQNTEKAAAPVQDMFMHRAWSQRIHIKLLRKAKILDIKIGKQSDFKHVLIENEENVTSRRNHFPPPRRPHGCPGRCPAVALVSTCGSCRHQSAARSTHPPTAQKHYNLLTSFKLTTTKTSEAAFLVPPQWQRCHCCLWWRTMPSVSLPRRLFTLR